jgi:aspartate/methionine/tyrosine aminotransferase
MTRLSKRTQRIDASGIRKVFALAAKLKNPVNLSIGQPDFDVPDPVKECAIAAIREGRNSYTQTAGNADLREKIKNRYDGRVEDVIVTSGVSGGLLLTFLSLLDEGDEILVPDPYFVMYKHLVNYIGAVPKFVDTYPDFRLRREVFEAQITDRTRAIIINSPNNPTGVVYTPEEMKMVADLASERGLVVISDEIYESFVYDVPFTSMLDYSPDAVILSGLSKSGAMTGWRLGWCAGPSDLVDAMAMIQQYSFVCAPSFAQTAAMTALDLNMEEQRKEYAGRRDIIYNGLSERFQVNKSQGAFYVFPQAPDGDGDAFVERAIENNLLVVPGSVFSESKSNFRISFATSREDLEKGIEILNDLAG